MLKIFIGSLSEGKNPKPQSILFAIIHLQFLLLFQLGWGIWQLITVSIHLLHISMVILPFSAVLVAAISGVTLPFVITYWLTKNIKLGKHWARIIYTILATGYCLMLLQVQSQQGSINAAIFFFHFYLSASPILYLFRKDSNEWFKQTSQKHSNPVQERNIT